jgi:hypothetical protein
VIKCNNTATSGVRRKDGAARPHNFYMVKQALGQERGVLLPNDKSENGDNL